MLENDSLLHRMAKTEKSSFPRRFLAALYAALSCCVFTATAFGQSVSIGLTQSQYVTDSPNQNQTNSYSSFVPSFLSEHTSKRGYLKTKAEVHAVVPLSKEDDFSFWFPDLYLRGGDNDTPADESKLSFTVGRKKYEWSRLDQDWGIGLWQPLYRWDYVRPQQMGLTGLFFESRSSDIKFTAFVSGVHLPDQQPSFKVVNGQLVSTNRWFRPPTASARISQGSSDVFYEVENPSAREVVFNPSVGFSFRTGDETYGPWTLFSLADKPANQFHIGIDTEGFNDLAAGNIHPVIHPTLVRHRLATAETGFQGERTSFYLSATAERFRDPKLPEKWEQTPLRDANYYGAGVSRDTRVLNTRVLLYSGFVYRDELKEEDTGILSRQLSSSTQKMSFERLWSIGARYPVYPQRHLNWSSEVKYTYSFSDGGEWLSSQVGYAPEPTWKLYVGFDVFGADNNFHGVESFISKYRDNDRVEGGFTHVF